MTAVRVSPPRIFPAATRASKPPADAAGSADAYRQASFTLGEDLSLVLVGLKLEGALADAAAGAKYRTQLTASALLLWSRAWLNRLEALHAVEWGNYAAAFPLIRAAADCQAAEVALLRSGAAEWQEWLDQAGIGLAPEEHAEEYRLHAFRSGEVLATDPVLGPVYRMATDFSLSHFGASLLIAGSDSDPRRVVATFGDRDFHLGLAEIALGWLLQLNVAQMETVAAYPAAFPSPPESAASHSRAALAAASRTDRCRVETIQRDEGQRYLVHNWRRVPGGASRKVLL